MSKSATGLLANWILLGTAALTAAPVPAILFVDVATGPVTGGPGNLGTPISIFGRGFGAAQGTSKVTIGGVEVAKYLEWGQNNANNPWLDMITVQPGPGVTGGPIVVSVGGVNSNADHEFHKNNGKVIYLSPRGSDSRGCSESSPCKTILNSLASKMKPGDVLLLRGGYYDQGEMWIRDSLGMSGTAAQRKTVKAYPGEKPIFPDGNHGVSIAASYLTFSGLNFRNGAGIGVPDDYSNPAAGGRGDWIMNNTVIGPIAYEGIGSHGDDHILAGNVVRVERSSQGTQGHCFYISHGDNVKVLYNTAEGAPGYGFHVFDQVRQAHDYRRTITNLLIEGNIVTGSKERSGLLMVVDDGGGWGSYGNYMENVTVRNNIFARNNHHGIVFGGQVRKVRIYNNTFYENGRQGIFVGSSPAMTAIEIRDNLIYQSPNNGVCKVSCDWYPAAHIQVEAGVAGPSGPVTIDHNGYFPGAASIMKGSGNRTSSMSSADPHPITGHAGLANAAAMDFSLATGSSAIDKGVALASVTRDFNGGVRPQGSAPDLGAFEYGSGSGAPRPKPTGPSGKPRPGGQFEGVSGDGVAAGWAVDSSESDQPVKVQIFVDRNSGTEGATPFESWADAPRSNAAPNGFRFEIPAQFRDGKLHQAWAWALGLADPDVKAQLDGSPRSFKLAAPKIPKSSRKPGVEACADGPIVKPCVCGGDVRSSSFCCKGEWHSYDSCK